MFEEDKIDLLLLNFSNYTTYPAYPYSFVQVSALARKHNLRVKRMDFLGLSAHEGAKIAERYVTKHKPRMIGFTLRQSDSTVGDFYVDSHEDTPCLEPWFPLEDTKLAIDRLRQATDAPIVTGGFSFSVDPIKTAEYLRPDFGVFGEPDSFLENFEDVLAGRSLENVKNLVFRSSDQGSDGYVSADRVYHSPLDDVEYNDEILEEIYNFHGYSAFVNKQLEPIPDFGAMFHGSTTAIEISRGCPCQCNFCCEPHVNGRSPRLRSLDVVEEEIRFLLSRGVRYFWFVCSELNSARDHSLELAERVIKINEERPDFPVFWRSYFTPAGLGYEDTRLLLRSGLLLEQNSNFSTLDDDNLAAMKEPYRAKDAIKVTKDQIDVMANDPSLASRPVNPTRMLWPFTANHFATPKTVAKTARIFNEEGLSGQYEGVLSYPALRVYSCCVDDLPQDVLDNAVTVCGEGRLKRPDPLHPTFYYTQSLVDHLGGIPALLDFMEYFHNTFMSMYYRATRDWMWFANKYLSPEALLGLIKELGPDIDVNNMLDGAWGEHNSRGLRNGLFSAELTKSLLREPDLEKVKNALNPVSVSEQMFPLHPNQKDQWEGALSLLFYILCREKGASSLKEIFSRLDIQTDKNGLPIPVPYFFMKGFYKRYNSNDELVSDIQSKFSLAEGDLTLFLFRYMIYQFNVKINPQYAFLLYE